jgi:hypothetical protein
MGNSLNIVLDRYGLTDGRPGAWVDLPNKCTDAKDIDDYFEEIRSYGAVPGDPSNEDGEQPSWFISKAERQALIEAQEASASTQKEAQKETLKSSDKPESDERERVETKRAASTKASTKQVQPITASASPSSKSGSSSSIDAPSQTVVKLKPTRG